MSSRVDRAVAGQAFVFRGHLAGAVLELPRRIGQDGSESADHHAGPVDPALRPMPCWPCAWSWVPVLNKFWCDAEHHDRTAAVSTCVEPV